MAAGPSAAPTVLGKILRVVDRTIEFAVFACFLAIVAVGFLQVFNRFVLNYSLSWSEEFQRYGHIWLVFLTVPVAYRYGAHIGMDVLLVRFPPPLQRAIGVAAEILWIVLAVTLIVGTYSLMQFLQFQRSPGMGLRMSWVYSAIIIGSVYFVLVALRRLAAHARGLAVDEPMDRL